MIKRMTIRKMSITLLSLIIIMLFYFFPSNKDIEYEEKYTYISENELKSTYMIDKYNLISMLMLPIKDDSVNIEATERIKYLMQDSEYNNIPNGFRPIIPSGTKIIDISFKDDTVIINFSKEILNINKEDEERMIESIIYTLTEIENINYVIIEVEGKVLEKLPNSNIKLPSTLSREYGINKIYDFEKLDGLTKTTIYYINKMNDEIYYTPVTKITNDSDDKVKIVINELKSSMIYQSNLSSYLNEAVSLYKYELEDGVLSLFFDDKIFSSDDKILEEVEYTIGMSMFENLDIKEVVFMVNNKKVLTFS